MLKPDHIPQQEPIIRVGIVLPEDNYTSVTIKIPQNDEYQLSFSGRDIPLQTEQEIFFRLTGNGIFFRLAGQEMIAPNKIRILPLHPEHLPRPGEGVLVKNVISGRNFHWQKFIHVTLPGALEISPLQDHLVLINELPLEHYLMCVATSEMGAASPAALIEAQTIAARSWMLANVEQKHVHLGFDVCNDDCCQRYQGTTFLSEQSIKGAVNTYGQVLLYNNKIVDARYSKSCGGVMESFENIWPGDPKPYLPVKIDAPQDSLPELPGPLTSEENVQRWIDAVPHTFCSPHVIPENQLKKYLGSVDEEGQYFRWQVSLNAKDLINHLKKIHQLPIDALLEFKILSRGGSGRINQMEIIYQDQEKNTRNLVLTSEYQIRHSMHPKFLYSSAFVVSLQKNKQNIIEKIHLKGAGWGHGVGLCQIGALGMALQGYDSKQIVLHYYPGSEIKQIY